jgi:uroporphyrinogen decarboxylase
MNARENFLAAIQFQSPRYVPLGNEPIYHSFQFEGNFQIANWTDHWGVRWEVGLADTVPFPKGNPLPSFDRLDDFHFPDPNTLTFTPEMQTALEKIDRSERLVKGELIYLLFERAWAIMGMENFLMAFATYPDEMHAFLHQIAHYARMIFDRYLELGVDAIGFSEDLGSQRALMISPAMFREFILPEYVYCFENVLRAGKIVHFHSCGCVHAVAKDLADIGVSILNPIQARANNLDRIKRDTIGRMALHGGIDTAVLAQGTPEDVRGRRRESVVSIETGDWKFQIPDSKVQ